MLRDSKEQGKEHQKRHEEVMAAFTHQGEADARRHAETMEALRQQGEALRVLIERTDPAAQPSLN